MVVAYPIKLTNKEAAFFFGIIVPIIFMLASGGTNCGWIFSILALGIIHAVHFAISGSQFKSIHRFKINYAALSFTFLLFGWMVICGWFYNGGIIIDYNPLQLFAGVSALQIILAKIIKVKL